MSEGSPGPPASVGYLPGAVRYSSRGDRVGGVVGEFTQKPKQSRTPGVFATP